MEKIDARTHSPQTQYEIRKQVIRLRKQGIPNQVLAEGVGISVYHASRIWQSYWKGGNKAIQLRVRGRQEGEKRTLTAEQEAQVKRDLIDKTPPDQLKLPFALWTREAVKLLIKHRFRIGKKLLSGWRGARNKSRFSTFPLIRQSSIQTNT